MNVAKDVYRNKLMTLLDELPESQIREVYHFSMFLKNWSEELINVADLPSVRVDHLHSLLGLIAIGGDAVKDTEALYHA